MKKLKLLSFILLILTAIYSCEKGARISEIIREDVPYDGDAIWAFELGNVDCDDPGVLPDGVVSVWPYTSGRKNYLGDGEFDGPNWPEGLVVSVSPDNKTVTFYLEDDAQFCVGAVIVKGGNGAIVYKYPFGTRGDTGLTSPLNSSGDPADLSNLTFCFVECKEELVVAVKAWYWMGDKTAFYMWAGSAGSLIPEFTGEWCTDYMGISPLSFNTSVNLMQGFIQTPAGSFTITPEGLVTVTLSPSNYIIDRVYIFIGTLAELKSTIESTTGCPAYSGGAPWQFFDDPDDNSNVFDFTVVF